MFPKPVLLLTNPRIGWIRKGQAQLMLRGGNLTVRHYNGTETEVGGAGGGLLQWGAIGGLLTAQQDLASALEGKADIAHTHSFADLTDKPTTLTGYGITDALTIADAALTYQPIGTYATGTGSAEGVNTGDQTDISGNAETVTAITGLLGAGTGLTLTGTGTVLDPYVIAQTAPAGLRSHSSADDTLLPSDSYVRTERNSAVIQRIPNDSVINFPLGTKITIRQAGTGIVTITPGLGVFVNGQLTTGGINLSLGLIKVGPNEWDTERGAF